MKTVILGDTHGRSFWKLIKEIEKPFDKIIFIGDYFDTHEDVSADLQMINFQEICKFKEENVNKVVLLIGNHDEHYFPFMGYSGTSGYQSGAAPAIGHLLMTYKDLLQMSYFQNNILLSHAGVGEKWFKNNNPEEFDINNITVEYISNITNDIWKYQPTKFKFTGWESSGDNVGQTPIWIRPQSLIKDTKTFREKGIIQIVGHTSVNKIDLEGSKKWTGGKLIMIDSLGTSGEYLVIEDDKFIVKNVK